MSWICSAGPFADTLSALLQFYKYVLDLNLN